MKALAETVRNIQTPCMKCPARHMGLCGMVGADTQASLGHLASTRDYPVNRLVWDEGKKPDFIGILVSGYLRFQRYRIDGRRQILGLLLPGDIIDEHLGPDSACSVEASTDARICRFDARQFQQLMARDPALVQAVYRLRSIKLDQLRALIWVVGALSAEQRLCAFLTTVTNFMPFTPLSGGGGLLTIELPRADIADLLATSVESISRITGHLHDQGVIRIHNARQFEIPDLDRLARLGCMQDTLGQIDYPKSMASKHRMMRLSNDRVDRSLRAVPGEMSPSVRGNTGQKSTPKIELVGGVESRQWSASPSGVV